MTKKILLVEDNVNLSDMYAEILRDEGYEVVTVDDGVEAEELIKNESWDLLLLDIMLPKLDGISILTDMVKENKINGRPVIIISNVNEQDLVQQCLNLGVKDFMVKAEISLDLLLKKISDYLSNEQH
ncbi:hypothetical protein A2415_03730 [candidate division WWE3 bacterium RIFOXYC1_FULL_39_7]|uniref:Response regulatory domain-containing protein n=2 Tax=Katanobacteria TaxID=422282 RepID=A0A1F4X4X1_UNCKA|nr:MAG: hypothetical protein A2415_03730 [candidate division WWE3 bacterium RIFOXYC1_FULL_39_7]OGC76193.1 MAG: hypothetical protein A2619_01240 [candidate division WWE3 bacterium RIFOXYD1_FULL_39_9]